MAVVLPFRALRPQPQLAGQVASLPYDVLNTQEARQAANGNPNSFLHITKSEIDLSDETNPYDNSVYETARTNLSAFISREVLFLESKPCYYLYQLTMQGRSQTGIVALSSIDEYERDLIKKHEYTRPDKELDRIRHISVSGAQTGNVFLAYRAQSDIDELIANWTKVKSPVYDFTAPDQIQHTIWVINDDPTIATITELFATKIPCTYIADGHHRAASAAKVRQNLAGDIPDGANYFLTTLFPSNQLRILDYNRLVTDLNGHTEEELLEGIKANFQVEPVGLEMVLPSAPHVFGMYLNKQWYKLVAKPGTFRQDPIGQLDVTILQENLLHPLLGIGDQRTDKRIDFVGGIRGLAELERRVNSGDMAIAFSLFPVTTEQLFAIADSGQVMPPKSTWFEPKLRDGLLTHLIRE
ncbi:MAG: DUF1015 domain-containing protein [Chitinophagaceae bacterium]|nr:DUF1015 domain-containing protein [Chitinophagaceae bacterium]MCA6478513.1 DUF1015 domain-containing protein [Chitinophagaceae bacterium]MCA6479192.1 DUF1015 domain-containing protein [Chitinophagaceae bacterium]MCA6491266.1 DUF1015 domain-containing protein [Chitinophagaceae bacterium]MCA6497238.1 DUF1015 domain-containing protein [Chitinophagaceae bacterium]